MRYKHTAFSNDFIAGCDGGLRHTSPNSENKAPGFVSESVSKNSFSQLTKRSAMKRNLIDAISFMDDQESTLDQMIQQLRYFLDSMSSFACQDALKYEYLLQVEAIKMPLMPNTEENLYLIICMINHAYAYRARWRGNPS